MSYEYALKHLLEKRHEIRLGKFGVTKELPSKKFAEVAPIYMEMWKAQKDGDGRPKHDAKSINERQRVFDNNLVSYFGKFDFDAIRTVDVEKWREARLKTGVLGTSVNREMVPLSDMFSEIAQAISLEKIEAFKTPLFKVRSDKGEIVVMNPCLLATKAQMRVRKVLVTDYELRKLKLAFMNLGDQDGWAICKLALKSILSEKDLRKLELGSVIDTERSKTQVPVHLPITILQKLNWHNWRKRWEAARKDGDLEHIQFRDLRKAGGNYLVGRKHDMKLVSQYHGHASVKTTEKSYTLFAQEKMKPLAEDLETWTEGL